MTAKYDLSINKGSNHIFWIQYLTEENAPVNLAAYGANMSIKRFKDQNYSLLFASVGGLTFGYTGPGVGGVFGSGGITLNKNYDGSSLTGGIKVTLGSVATDSFDYGKYFYTLNLTIGTTYNERLLEGRITFE